MHSALHRTASRCLASLATSPQPQQHSASMETRAAKRAREVQHSATLQEVEARLRAFGMEAHPATAASPRPAAVLVPLFASTYEPGSPVRVLLTQRSANLSTHRGEVGALLLLGCLHGRQPPSLSPLHT
jgi:hypothetical protein